MNSHPSGKSEVINFKAYAGEKKTQKALDFKV